MQSLQSKSMSSPTDLSSFGTSSLQAIHSIELGEKLLLRHGNRYELYGWSRILLTFAILQLLVVFQNKYKKYKPCSFATCSGRDFPELSTMSGEGRYQYRRLERKNAKYHDKLKNYCQYTTRMGTYSRRTKYTQSTTIVNAH